MTQPLVSIIIVSYNHSAFLRENLESVASQTYKNWELIVADDASQDQSVAIISEWLSENNIFATTVFHDINVGLCHTLNECISLCSGKYVKILAADDVMDLQLIKKAVEKLEKLGDDYGLCYANAQIIDGLSTKKEEYLIDRNRALAEGWVRDELYRGNFIPALTVLIRKSVFDNLNGYDPNILVEDYEYWLRMSPHYKFAVIDDVLAYYRIHGSNISINHNIQDDIARIMIKYDITGEKVADINRMIIDRYNYGNMSAALKADYYRYIGKTGWLTFSLRHNIPYMIFRIINKFFKIN